MSLSTRNFTPEELYDAATEPPLLLELRCTGCGKRFRREFGWACMSPRHAAESGDWDGVLLSDMVECPRCGAVDEYRIPPTAMLRLTAALLAELPGTGRGGRVIAGVSKLWDGTIARRPSHALARLRSLTREHPESAEAFRRLGNACQRWHLMDEALSSWRKACELDENELEAAYSLANYLLEAGKRPEEGSHYLQRAVRTIPDAVQSGRVSGDFARHVIGLLEVVMERTEDSVGLMAAWASGEIRKDPVVTVSSVDLAKIGSFERLADLVSTGFFLRMELTPELPKEEPTHLQLLLTTGSSRFPMFPDHHLHLPKPSRKPGGAANSAGRNSPCPCGSGKKHKRCCG